MTSARATGSATERQVPLVSVVTATLNPGPLFERCLESVATQSHPRLEHIVIDGGSSDGTVERLEQAKGVRWLSEPDSGASEAINKGMRMARGSYLTMLHGDDALTPDAVARAVARFRGDDAIGWVYGNMLIEAPDRTFVHRPPATLRLEDLDFDFNAPLQGAFFTSWALDKVGEIDESLTLVEDIDLALRLLRAGVRTAYIPEVQAIYAVREDSKTGSHPWADSYEQRHRVYMKEGMTRQAGVALIRMERQRSYDVIDEHLAAGRYREAAKRARLEHRFMYPIFARHRFTFLATKHAPRLMRLAKKLKRRF